MIPAESSADRIFVVVTAFNESRTIADVAQRLLKHYPNVVVVDDGSSDGTSDCVKPLHAHLLQHRVNRGQGAALQTGIEYALSRGAEVVVTFDGDGQHKETDIAALVRPILRGDCDVALGSRFLGHAPGMPFSRRLLLKAATLFTRVTSRVRVTDVHNGLRAFSRRAAASLHLTMDRMAHASEILDQVRRAGWRYQEVPVEICYSAYSLAKGQSSWNALRIGSEILVRKVLH